MGDQAKLEHAVLRVFTPSKDSLDKPGAEIGTIEFQFNPKELTMSKSAKWGKATAKHAKTSGPPQYLGPEPAKMTLEMFFDASAAQDDSVEKKVAALFECCVPTADSRAQKQASAPWVLFRWGTLTGFHAYVKSVSVKYTLFSAAGSPLRAICTVNLEEIAGEAGKQNPTSGGLMPRKVHVIAQGDSLAGLAYREYGDAALWRPLATVNRIDDPQRLRPGSTVYLPTATELTDGAKRETAAREVSRAPR